MSHIRSLIRSFTFAAMLTPAVALAAVNKTDTIKSADFPGGGFRVGDTIRATFVMSGSGSGAYDRTAVAVEGPNHGPIQVTFDKPPTAATIMYVNVRTGQSLSTIFKSTNGEIGATGGEDDIISLLRVGDRYPLLASTSSVLSTWTDVDTFINDASLSYNQSFNFVNGVCTLLPGTFVLDQNGTRYTGAAEIGAFNEVGIVPTPGSIALLGVGALTAARRRRC